MIKIEKQIKKDGEVWRSKELLGKDNGYSTVKMFVKTHQHEGWKLTIFDTEYRGYIKTKCELEEVAKLVSQFSKEYEFENITQINESKRYKSYVVRAKFGSNAFEETEEYEDEWKTLDEIIEEEYIGQSFSSLIESEE